MYVFIYLDINHIHKKNSLYYISAVAKKKPIRAKERPSLRVAKSAKMNTNSSLMKEDFQQWKPSPGGKKVRSKSKSSFAPNKGTFEAKSTAKSDYTSVLIQNSSNQGRAKPKHNLRVY